ncbi:MAG: Gfo/Idh/MocA family oxidoreductase [Candidatus Rokubacteria bacterium]|nr:Gfo/Idh/MocA family oxidoreductase [Candidatus Rokubacteria bacterium]
MQPSVVAVLGTGSIGGAHLRALSQEASVRPVAVPVRRTRLAELAAAGFGVAEDLAEAARQGATAAVIATDSGRHLGDALEAMACGLDLLVEKPLAVDAEEARQLCARAEALSRHVFVGCTLRFSESLGRFREWLPRVGRVHAVRIECRSFLPSWRPGRPYQASYSSRRGEGGVLRDLIHEIDYAGWLFGWPAAVHARLSNLGRLGIDAEELAELTWEDRYGGVVSVGLDYLTAPTRRRMQAFGERGMLEWDGVEQAVRLSLAGRPEERVASPQAREAMLQAQDLAALRAWRGEPDARLASGEDGWRALAVCDAARRSSETGREEPVAYGVPNRTRAAEATV